MIDINKEQRRASNPLSSVWVSASAGSGKTKVLTDRVLNLLLMTGRPEKLLCLTFTKAAAAEMANRISSVLKKWATCSEPDLVKELETLCGETPVTDKLIRARQLFAKVLDAPGGINIMTIHSFCQSVLKRFPLEAGISPDFDIIDDVQAQGLLSDSLKTILSQDDFQSDIRELARYKTEDDLIKLLQDLFTQRSKLLQLRKKHSLNTLIAQIKQQLNLSKYDTPLEIIAETFSPDDWPAIQKKYLTQKGIAGSKKANDPIAQAAEEVAQKIKNLKLIDLTHSLLHLAYSVLESYQRQKQSAGLLDYDDLISLTKDLLSQSSAAAWVLFKLDGGIDHILVDEAQDTNPDQWTIIRLLAEEFFAGMDGHDTVRTIFAVGDRKQSIYSFQGADPDEFEHMHHFFESKIKASENDFETVPFNLSFRSAPPILDLVNSLLQNPLAREGVLLPSEEAPHAPYRENDAGLVEIWPLEEHCKTDEPAPWKPPVERIQNQSSLSRLAEKVADKITTLIKSREILESEARPIRAGDFLVLVQRRNQFVTELVRLLKDRNIPVAGIDRLNLSDHIAVQDLLAAAKFALLPEDDLNLACLLKSPFINLGEDDLFKAAYNRNSQTLWQRVQTEFPTVAEKLKQLLSQADKITPYDFFSLILGPMGGRKSFLSRLGNEANEAINEFLNLALHFEQDNESSLQKFVHFMQDRKIEIKRDMESNQDAVRIMTVHASKGLQGNIVFLPQTRYIKRQRSPFLWLSGELPLWLPNQSLSSVFTDHLTRLADNQSDAENKRLLYVAVTRARDRLYVCGYDGGTPAKPDNWYDLIKNSLKKSADTDGIIRLKSKQKRPTAPTDKPTQRAPQPLPAWAFSPAPVEPVPPRPLSPSQEPSNDIDPRSPLSPGQAQALERGKFIHALLQYLPDIPQERWPTVISKLKPAGIDVPDNLTDLLCSGKFAPLFGKDSIAEVPVVGVWNNRVISGQIDRLIVQENEVWIVDFKTNRIVPIDEKSVSENYKNQLKAYRGLISQIFSDKVIRTYLLWTETLNLMEIKDED